MRLKITYTPKKSTQVEMNHLTVIFLDYLRIKISLYFKVFNFSF